MSRGCVDALRSVPPASAALATVWAKSRVQHGRRLALTDDEDLLRLLKLSRCMAPAKLPLLVLASGLSEPLMQQVMVITNVTVVDVTNCSAGTPRVSSVRDAHAKGMLVTPTISWRQDGFETMPKLFLWALTPITHVLYFDLDSVISGDPGPFFWWHGATSLVASMETRHGYAVGWRSNVMMLQPSLAIHEALQQKVASFDFAVSTQTDQDILESFFCVPGPEALRLGNESQSLCDVSRTNGARGFQYNSSAFMAASRLRFYRTLTRPSRPPHTPASCLLSRGLHSLPFAHGIASLVNMLRAPASSSVGCGAVLGYEHEQECIRCLGSAGTPWEAMRGPRGVCNVQHLNHSDTGGSPSPPPPPPVWQNAYELCVNASKAKNGRSPKHTCLKYARRGRLEAV